METLNQIICLTFAVFLILVYKENLAGNEMSASRTSPTSDQHLESSWLVILKTIPRLPSGIFYKCQSDFTVRSKVNSPGAQLTCFSYWLRKKIILLKIKSFHFRVQLWESQVLEESLSTCWSKTAVHCTPTLPVGKFAWMWKKKHEFQMTSMSGHTLKKMLSKYHDTFYGEAMKAEEAKESFLDFCGWYYN